MNQENIGKFIQQLRKEKGLTQMQLAEQLHITDRAVSKWENGRSVPDAGIMLELCSTLGISVNELLSGHRIENKDFLKEADQNLLKHHAKEAMANRNLLSIELVVLVLAILMMSLGAYLYEEVLISGTWILWITFVPGVIAVLLCARIEMKTGYYKCQNCQKTFIPGVVAFLVGPHLGFRRVLKCPYCGKITLCRKVLTED